MVRSHSDEGGEEQEVEQGSSWKRILFHSKLRRNSAHPNDGQDCAHCHCDVHEPIHPRQQSQGLPKDRLLLWHVAKLKHRRRIRSPAQQHCLFAAEKGSMSLIWINPDDVLKPQ